MENQKSNDELARELRIRVVREVAVQGSQLKILSQEANALNTGINDFDKDRKAFLQTLLAECEICLESRTLGSTAGTIEEKYRQYIRDSRMENERAKNELEKLKSKIAALKTALDGVLAKIKEDVLAERYGRGELILSMQGLQRIIGRISYLDESTNPAFGIILGKSKKTKAATTEIAWLCENSPQNPPLFFMDINLMPLNEEELSRICWENDDYQLLVNNIPEDQIVWPVGSIFCLDKGGMCEAYLISRGNDCVDVVRIEKSTYPHWKVEILGRALRNEKNLKALCRWQGYNEVPVDLKFVSHEFNASLNMMEWHLFRKYPGVILEMPQWEGERPPIS